MVIRPISNVNYNRQNYNNLNFEARKKNDNQYHEAPRRSSGLLKSIPLAAIIAMSPLNSTQAQNYNNLPIDKIVYRENFGEGKHRYTINYISNDGVDTDAEKISVSNNDTTVFRYPVNGERVPCQKVTYRTMDVDSMVVKNITMKFDNGKEREVQGYYVIGKKSTIDGAITALDNPNQILQKGKMSKIPHTETEITEALFNHLNEITGGQIPIKQEYYVEEYTEEKLRKHLGY